MRKTTIVLTTIAVALAASTTAPAQEFIPIPPLAGDDVTFVRAVSGDGSTVVGTSGSGAGRAFVWTESTGSVELPGTGGTQAWDVNFDGSIIVGQDDNGGVRWTNGVPETLPGNSSFPTFLPHAVSDDGTIISGRAFPPAGPFSIVAKWTASGLTDLGELQPDTFPLLVTDMTPDGSVIVGLSEPQAYRWTESSGMVGLGFLPGFMDLSIAECVSADGNVVGGQANVAKADGYVAVYWTDSTGWVEIPSIIPSASVADAVNAMNHDGTFMVGRNTGFDPPARELFIWNPTDGPSPLQQTLEHVYGVDFLGWQLANLPSPFNNEGDVLDMSPDGKAIIGVTLNPTTETRWGWIVRLNPADLDNDGTVDIFDLLELLKNWNTSGNGATIADPKNIVDVFDLLELLNRWNT